MTQEEKQLLLIIDLCARLPYRPKGVKLNLLYDPENISINGYDRGFVETLNDEIPIENVRLYLRPMSSMTEKEKEELKQEHSKDEKLFAECLRNVANGDNSMRGKVIPHFAADWCNKNHFDYRGLIPMGLALEAPEDMYKKK
jgi:hypothetical protein